MKKEVEGEAGKRDPRHIDTDVALRCICIQSSAARWHHCFKCFYGTQEKLISRKMQDDSFLLPEPTSYFYLCGVASGSPALRGERNLHLAVRPKQGHVAIVKSFYGPTFTIQDAEEIAIQGPIETMPELEVSYTRCKNFRFAAQMYNATGFDPGAPHAPIRIPRDSPLM